VNDGAVANCDIFFKNKPGLSVFAVSDDVVLYIAVTADTNWCKVAT